MARENISISRNPVEVKLTLIAKNGKYGFADESGTEVIPCQWKDADVFYEDLARVKNSFSGPP